uniref:Uncharacterized protein n=1 Tax=Romanomermis culicivorax TaxID=13658 RepID=A0A915I3P5_ROMCU
MHGKTIKIKKNIRITIEPFFSDHCILQGPNFVQNRAHSSVNIRCSESFMQKLALLSVRNKTRQMKELDLKSIISSYCLLLSCCENSDLRWRYDFVRRETFDQSDEQEKSC